MHPTLLTSLLISSAVIGSIFYSYTLGKKQEQKVCEAEKIKIELAQKEVELQQQFELTELQKEQTDDAKDKLSQEKIHNKELRQSLEKALSNNSTQCVPSVVLDSLREYRSKTRNKNS